jgi:DNA repair ATPase RecN
MDEAMSEQIENALQQAIRTLKGEQRQMLADFLRRAVNEVENAESVIGEGDAGVEPLADFVNEHLSRPLEDLTLMLEAAMDDLEEAEADEDADDGPGS